MSLRMLNELSFENLHMKKYSGFNNNIYYIEYGYIFYD